MNSPFRPLADEIRRIAAAGFDYVDLTLEPPGAWPVVPDEVRALLDETGLGVVGHTAWYLPIASPFPQLRAAARALLVTAFDVFAAVGATHVNVHPDPVMRSYPRADAIGAEEGVPVLPFHDTLEDPERPGRMREEWTDDGDHPSVEGYRLLGELAAPVLSRQE